MIEHTDYSILELCGKEVYSEKLGKVIWEGNIYLNGNAQYSSDQKLDLLWDHCSLSEVLKWFKVGFPDKKILVINGE